MASSNKIGRKATKEAMTGVEDILKSAPGMIASAQSNKTENALKAAVAPQKAQTFAEAFKAARAEKGAGKTFTFGGKSYSTNMASDAPRKAASSAPARSSAPATRTMNLTGVNKPTGSVSKVDTRFFNKKPTGAPMKREEPKKSAEPSGKKGTLKERFQSGTLFKKAKGGSIDGCAVRGKTRAPMKKGK